MNIQPIGCKTYNSKNQNSPNFKATIVSEFGLNVSLSESDRYCKLLKELILANLPISNPKEYALIEAGDRVLAPIDDNLAGQAKRFVGRIQAYLYRKGFSRSDLNIDFDSRTPDKLVWAD